MLSKRVTRTLITFMRNVKINATENATVHKPSFKWSGEKLRPETSGAPPLGRSHFQPLLLAEVPLGHAVCVIRAPVASKRDRRVTYGQLLRSDVFKEHAPRAAVLPVTPVADNRVAASERTATTVQVCRSASMFSAASLAIWMDVHICAPFQLRNVATLQLQVDLS